MEYKIERKNEESKVIITVTFSPEELNNKQNEVKKENENIEPGDLFVETFNKLVSDSYVEIINKEKLLVVSMPQISLDHLAKDNSSVGYVATVDVYPTLQVNTYKGLNVKMDAVSTTKEEIDREVKASLANKASYKDSDEPVRNGHLTIIDFTGRIDGKEFEGGKSEKYKLEVGSNTFIPGFEQQMLGMKKGETRILKLKFPENYVNDLAGKDVDFEVTIHEIKEKVTPELTNEFIKSLEMDGIETVNDYERVIEGKIFIAKQNKAIEKLHTEIIDKLLSLNPVVIPESMIQKEIDYRIESIRKQAEMYKLTLETFLQYSGFESVEKFKEIYHESAAKSIHLEMFLDKIVELENIETTEEEIERFYNEYAVRQQKSIDEVKAMISIDQVKYSYSKDKALDLLIELNKM